MCNEEVVKKITDKYIESEVIINGGDLKSPQIPKMNSVREASFSHDAITNILSVKKLSASSNCSIFYDSEVGDEFEVNTKSDVF